jgi:citrate lyase subunit beta/citryl-CoA lyase
MVVEVVNGAENHFGRVGARIHDITHPHWQQRPRDPGRRRRQAAGLHHHPKVRSAADAAEQIRELRRVEAACSLERALPVHVLIETHGALREAWEIAALDGVESLDFGLMDFVSGHHGAIPGSAMKSPGQFEHPLVVRAKADIAAAALANGVVPSHNVTTELQDVAVIRHDAERARREFGYLRMWSIHPNQILPIIAAMQPDFTEVEEAAAILIAAQDNAWGPIQHAGLHDRASYRYYWELLQRARNTGMELPDRRLRRLPHAQRDVQPALARQAFQALRQFARLRAGSALRIPDSVGAAGEARQRLLERLHDALVIAAFPRTTDRSAPARDAAAAAAGLQAGEAVQSSTTTCLPASRKFSPSRRASVLCSSNSRSRSCSRSVQSR